MKKKLEVGDKIRVEYGDNTYHQATIVSIRLGNIVVVEMDLNNGLGLRQYAVHSSQCFAYIEETIESNSVEGITNNGSA